MAQIVAAQGAGVKRGRLGGADSPSVLILDETHQVRFDSDPSPQKSGLSKRELLSGGRSSKNAAQNLLDRWGRYREGPLAFMKGFGLPFDNNQPEWGLRMRSGRRA
jgi:hypothetical protein